MKKFLLFLPILLSFAMATQAQQAAVQQGDVAIKSINPSGVKTPQYSLLNGATMLFTPGTWLQVEVNYSTEPDVIDELTFDYSILVGTTSQQQLITGATTYVDIAKGRDHYAVVYISPHAIAKLLGPTTPFTTSTIRGIQVSVSHQGQKLDTKAKGAEIQNMPVVTGMITNKPDTPFAPLFWDRYEMIKPSGH